MVPGDGGLIYRNAECTCMVNYNWRFVFVDCILIILACVCERAVAAFDEEKDEAKAMPALDVAQADFLRYCQRPTDSDCQSTNALAQLQVWAIVVSPTLWKFGWWPCMVPLNMWRNIGEQLVWCGVCDQ